MKQTLNHLLDNHALTSAESRELLHAIVEGRANPAQIAALATVFRMRPLDVAELAGFRDALLELCVKIDLGPEPCIDVCGTGGDGKDTFNISTLTALVLAGAGFRVAKHGNYGVSSTSGSSNVLEHLGVRFTNDEDTLRRSLDRAGVCFLHAPLFHPALKAVQPIRRELEVRTFFNILGPLVNPARPSRKLIGVASLELLRLYAYLLERSHERFTVVHALDGYDEVSLTGECKLQGAQGERYLAPADFGLPTVRPEEIVSGGSVEEAARRFVAVLEGRGTDAQNAVVIANAALGISVMNPSERLADSVTRARESLESGAALRTFKTITEITV